MGDRPISQSSNQQLLAAFIEYAKTFPDFPGNITIPSLGNPSYVPPNRSQVPFVLSIVLMAGSFLVVCARLLVRRHTRQWGWDDWFMLPATLATAGFTIMQCVALTKGRVGYHIYDLPISTILYSFKNLAVLLFSIATTLIKLSICLYILRLCPDGDRFGRRMVITTFMFVIVIWIASFLMTVFQCTPNAAAWDLTVRLFQETSCASLWKEAVGWSVAYGLINLWLLILPVRFVYRLKLPLGQKVGLFGIFILGGVATILSFLKLTVLRKAFDSWDPTWNFFEVMIYTILELTLGLVAASLPAFGFLLAHIGPEHDTTLDTNDSGRRKRRSWMGSKRQPDLYLPPSPNERAMGEKRDVESLFSHHDSLTRDSRSVAGLTLDDTESRFMEQVARLMTPSEEMQRQMYQYRTSSSGDLPERPAPVRTRRSIPSLRRGVSDFEDEVIPEEDEEDEHNEHEHRSRSNSHQRSYIDNDGGYDSHHHTDRIDEEEEDEEGEGYEHEEGEHSPISSLYSGSSSDSTSTIDLVIQTPRQSQLDIARAAVEEGSAHNPARIR